MPKRHHLSGVSRPASPATRGYVLIESLTAFAVVGIGLLPLAALWPTGLQWLRHLQTVAQGTRIAAERVEMAPLPHRAPTLSTLGNGPATALRAVPCDESPTVCGDERLVLTGPLGSDSVGTPAGLRWIALWSKP